MPETKVKCENPIFIVGCPRSGTTILASILNKHPNIAAATETHFFNFVSKQKKYKWDNFDFTQLQELLDESRINDFINLAEIDIEEINSEFKELKCISNKKQIFDLLMNSLILKKNKSRFCEKTPQHLQNVKEILELYPQAKIIHIIRDGRDTVNSLLKMPWRPKGLVNNARFWLQYTKLGKDIEAKLVEDNLVSLAQRSFMSIKYEKLLQEPEESIKKICEFIGEDFDNNLLSQDDKQENVFATWENTWKHKANEELDSTRITAWKRELDEDEQTILEWILAAKLTELGYDCDKPQLKLKHWFRVMIEHISITWRKIFRTITNLVN